jgi:hypothetical protein
MSPQSPRFFTLATDPADLGVTTVLPLNNTTFPYCEWCAPQSLTDGNATLTLTYYTETEDWPGFGSYIEPGTWFILYDGADAPMSFDRPMKSVGFLVKVRTGGVAPDRPGKNITVRFYSGSTVIATQTRFVGDYRLDSQGTFFGISSPDLPITKYELVFNSADGWDPRYLSEVRYALADQDSVTLNCTPSRLQREDRVDCIATPPRGQTIESWWFVPTDTGVGGAPIYRSSGATSTTWGGKMVATGEVFVRSSDQKTASASIDVTNRPWGQEKLPPVSKRDLRGGPEIVWCRGGRFMADPPLDRIVGAGCNQILLDYPIVPSDWFSLIQDGGPIQGLSYSFKVPGTIEIVTSVNEAALAPNSVTYKYAPADPAPGNLCGKSWFTNRLMLTRQHEGDDLAPPHPLSHPNTIKKGYTDYYVKAVEALVRRGYPTTFDVRGYATQGDRDARRVTNQLTHVPDVVDAPWYSNCDLKVTP